MNAVVCSVAKTFLNNGYRVIGLHGGYSGLFSKTPRTEDLDFFKADAYFNRGGCYLQMSRFKPTDADFEDNFNLDLFRDNNIKLLVTVGGDDTASTANRIAKFLEAKKYPIRNIHVPKTIDDDLPLPDNAPTFGFNSAKASAKGRVSASNGWGSSSPPRIAVPGSSEYIRAITSNEVCPLMIRSRISSKRSLVRCFASFIENGNFVI